MRYMALAVAALPLMAFASPTMAESEFTDAIQDDYDHHLGALFREFHENPELSLLETKTAAHLAGELRALGFEVTEGVGGTGIVALLKNGEGPTVLIRTDMDGLPIKEDSGLSYASTATQKDMEGKVTPVMHACGHDSHMTSLVGTAKELVDHKGEWTGTLMLIGQPAEERLMGARMMLEDGLYTRFPKPDYALGFHVVSGIETGTITVPGGEVMASADSIDIIVHGVATHGAVPQQGIDPVLVASQIVVSLQSIVSRNVNPQSSAVVTVGMINGGTKRNIIGDRVELQLTVRADSEAVRQQLMADIARVARGVAISMGVPDALMPEIVTHTREATLPILNDPETSERVRNVLIGAFGADKISSGGGLGMASEDFALFATEESGVKGTFFFVGGTPAADLKSAPPHHSAFFKIAPEPVITTAVEAMTLAALEVFKVD